MLPAHDPTQPPLQKTTKRAGVNAPEIAKLREILAQMCGGRDLTQLPAHTHYGVLQLIGEVGTDLTYGAARNTSPPGLAWRPATTTAASERLARGAAEIAPASSSA